MYLPLLVTISVLSGATVLAISILHNQTRRAGQQFNLVPPSLPIQYPDIPRDMADQISREVSQCRTTIASADLFETPASNFGLPHTRFENVHLPTAVHSTLSFLEHCCAQVSASLVMKEGELLPEYLHRIHSTITPQIPLSLLTKYLLTYQSCTSLDKISDEDFNLFFTDVFIPIVKHVTALIS
ncbi:hypothetical protein RCL1_005526 [Eukaryota sp. TZLM3-RCL]